MPEPRTGGRLARALLSALALSGLVAGLPWLLWHATTTVWTSGTDALTHLLTRSDTTSAFVLVLCLVGWAAWAVFTLSVLLEIPAQLRGRTVPRLPGMRLSQRAAGTLVSAILVAFASGNLASATPAHAHTTVATALVQQPATAAAAATDQTAAGPSTDSGTGARTYTVRDTRPAESLWSIAEHLYGRGELYTKIADANEGRPMPDGRVFHAAAPIQPGWVLHLPDDTHTTAPPTSGHPTTTSQVVKKGDTLWSIAEAELGDGERFDEIFQANKDARQEDGGRLTDPDHLEAGWTLKIPDTTSPAEQPRPETTPPKPRPDTDQHATTPPAPVPSAAATPPHTADSPSAAPTPKPTTPPAPPKAPSVAASPAPSTPAPATAPADEENTGIGVRNTAGIGMLAAGTVLIALGLKRLLQRRRRRPGELPATTEHSAEQTLHATADTGSVELLDTALRTLAHHATDHDLPLPKLAGARITARTVELLLADAAQDADEVVIAPFTPAATGRWVLDRAQNLLDTDEAAAVPAPYPGLVTLGTDPDGNHLLINLTRSRVLLLDGTPDAVRDTARVLALEAATSTWSDHSEILTVGLGDDLPALLPTSRMRTLPHLKAARTDLAELLLEQRQAAADDGAPIRLPWTLVCAADMDEDEARALADTLTAARDLPVALVLPAQGTAGAFGTFDEAVQLAVGTTTPQYVDVLDSDLTIQSLPEHDYADLLDLLRTADEPARPAEGPWKSVPPIHITHTTTDIDDGTEMLAGPAALPAVPFTALTTASIAAPAAASTPAPEPATGSKTVLAPVLPSPDPAPAPETAPEAPPVQDRDEPVDLHAPEIQILGPITVTGIAASGHGPKLAQLAAYLYAKPGSPDAVSEAMNPRSPWSKPTLQTRISQLRNRLGSDSEGNPYVPRDHTGIYRLSPKVRCDWDRFLPIAERGLGKGPSTGIADLEAALGLVRGRPYGDNPPAWAATRVQEMLARIIDTAHTLATWHRTGPRPDLDAARRAVRIGLDIDDSAELLYQDWMLIEDQAGNRPGVTTAYETLLTINRRLDISAEPDTEAIYEKLTTRTA